MEDKGEVRPAERVTVLDPAGLHLGAHMGDRVEGEHPDTLTVEPGSVRRARLLHLQRGGRLQSSTLTPGWSLAGS
jgi:hypothetical protein